MSDESKNNTKENSKENTKENEYKTWSDFDINTELLRGIYAYGFDNPSEIQSKTFHHIAEGRDIIAQAQSGCGKTGAFTIGALQKIDVSQKNVQAIIIAPTHELAKQISIVMTSIGSMIVGLRIKTIMGGTSIQQDAADIRTDTPHVVVGCAGRIHDMLKRRYLDAKTIRFFVLDEADEMLSSGFREQIHSIFQFFDENIQVALFSATIPNDILLLSQKFMRNPVKIIVKPEDLSLKCIDQFYMAMRDDYAKFDMLKHLFSAISISQCIIYCNSVNRVMDLYNGMKDDGYSVCAIHSSMDKEERKKTFLQFRDGTYRVLISSNVTARGIDIQQVSTVINFDVPNCTSTYLHRIGRSGRWGRKGCAINFITRRDVYMMKKIEDEFKINIAEMKVPA